MGRPRHGSFNRPVQVHLTLSSGQRAAALDALEAALGEDEFEPGLVKLNYETALRKVEEAEVVGTDGCGFPKFHTKKVGAWHLRALVAALKSCITDDDFDENVPPQCYLAALERASGVLERLGQKISARITGTPLCLTADSEE